MGLYPKDNPINVVAIAAWPWEHIWVKKVSKGHSGQGLVIHSPSRKFEHVPRKVCGYYVNSQLSKKEAVSGGFDEGLLLDTEGYVSEGSGENIFIVRNNVLKTTPLTLILEGITRDSILRLACDLELRLAEQRFTRDEIYICDESFFSHRTAAEVTPIRELDNRTIGKGKAGPVTKKLQAAFFDIVKGKNAKYESWLTCV